MSLLGAIMGGVGGAAQAAYDIGKTGLADKREKAKIKMQQEFQSQQNKLDRDSRERTTAAQIASTQSTAAANRMHQSSENALSREADEKRLAATIASQQTTAAANRAHDEKMAGQQHSWDMAKTAFADTLSRSRENDAQTNRMALAAYNADLAERKFKLENAGRLSASDKERLDVLKTQLSGYIETGEQERADEAMMEIEQILGGGSSDAVLDALGAGSDIVLPGQDKTNTPPDDETPKPAGKTGLIQSHQQKVADEQKQADDILAHNKKVANNNIMLNQIEQNVERLANVAYKGQESWYGQARTEEENNKAYYIKMLDEIAQNGTPEQVERAKALFSKLMGQ